MATLAEVAGKTYRFRRFVMFWKAVQVEIYSYLPFQLVLTRCALENRRRPMKNQRSADYGLCWSAKSQLQSPYYIGPGIGGLYDYFSLAFFWPVLAVTFKSDCGCFRFQSESTVSTRMAPKSGATKWKQKIFAPPTWIPRRSKMSNGFKKLSVYCCNYYIFSSSFFKPPLLPHLARQYWISIL